MAEIIFRLPSKATQYGYVEIRDTVDTEVTPEELAEKYAAWVIRFQTTEMAAKPKRPDSRLVGDIMADDEPHPATQLSDEEVKEMVRTELGGSVVSETPAPWDGKGEVPANLQPKPWQKGARKAPVANLFD